MQRIFPDRVLTAAERSARHYPKVLPEVRRADAKRRYDKNPEKVLAGNQRWRLANKEKHCAGMKTWRKNNLAWWLWYTAKGRARTKGLPFNITRADVQIPLVCPVLGIPLVAGEGKSHDGSPTLDRIINEAGYIVGNVLVVSRKANTMKSNATPAEMRRVADFYAGV